MKYFITRWKKDSSIHETKNIKLMLVSSITTNRLSDNMNPVSKIDFNCRVKDSKHRATNDRSSLYIDRKRNREIEGAVKRNVRLANTHRDILNPDSQFVRVSRESKELFIRVKRQTEARCTANESYFQLNYRKTR